MATMVLVGSATWSNFIGAPGYTKLAFQGTNDVTTANGITAAMRAFFSALAAYLPNGLTIQVQQVVEAFDPATSTLLGEASATTLPTPVTGTAVSTLTYSGGTGVYIAWKTGQVAYGRRIQGRSFLVPMVSVADTNGTLTSAAITVVTNAGNGLIGDTATQLAVWGKNWSKAVPPAKPTQIGGDAFVVSSCLVADKTGILKSRRD